MINRAAIALAVAVSCSGALAEEAAPVLDRQWWQTTDLREHIGQTYLQTFLADTVGLHAKIVADYAKPITVVDADTVVATMALFDPRIPKWMFEDFDGGEAGFKKTIDGVAGQTIAPRNLRDALQPFVDANSTSGNAHFAISEAEQMALMASGSGTLVVLDDHNYFYNVGFQDPIRYSGRSYGASNDRKLLDPQDSYYLKEMDTYFGADNPDPSPVFQVLFDLLTRTDSRGLADLPADAQVLVVDFMSIYTAELDRNNMANLSPTQWAWQSDLAEVTLLSAYTGVAGLAIDGGKLVECDAFAFEASHGITRRASFMQLSRLITQYLKENHPDLVYEVMALTPLTEADVISFVDGDVLRRVITFLNRPETQPTAAANAEQLTDAMVSLLRHVRTDQAAITAFVEKTVPRADGKCAWSK